MWAQFDFLVNEALNCRRKSARKSVKWCKMYNKLRFNAVIYNFNVGIYPHSHTKKAYKWRDWDDDESKTAYELPAPILSYTDRRLCRMQHGSMRHATRRTSRNTQISVTLSYLRVAICCLVLHYCTFNAARVVLSRIRYQLKCMRRNSVSLAAHPDAAHHIMKKNRFLLSLRPLHYIHSYTSSLVCRRRSSGSVRQHGATTTTKANPTNNDVCSMQWSTSMIHFSQKRSACLLPSNSFSHYTSIHSTCS